MSAFILIRGGGDLASGVALRLYRAGFQVAIAEIAQPLAVRRTVAFAEAVFAGVQTVEKVTARLVSGDQLWDASDAGEIPVIVDPTANVLANLLLTSPRSTLVVDARLTKQTPEPLPIHPRLHIGLGPGFRAGENCDAAIETRRSHTLGRVYWDGMPQPDSGQPEGDARRVLRASSDGTLIAHAAIGDHLQDAQLIAEIRSEAGDRTSKIFSPFKGVLRGLLHEDIPVTSGMKIGDVDSRDDDSVCRLVSDKALAVGGGVLEALLTKAEIRELLFQ